MILLHLISLFLSAIPATLALTTPPSGAKVVRQTGTQAGEYSYESSTVSAAVASLSGTASATIFIYPGTYVEQVTVTYGGPLTIYGYSTNGGNWKANTVTIAYNLNAQDNGGNDPSSTFRAHSNNFEMYNVNIQNTYGPGVQATALAARGTKQGYYGCAFYGYQDTLLADAAGPQYYSNCYIQGAIDYIYGAASAWFGECMLASIGSGAITAKSREVATDTSYYIIDSSTITSNTTTDLTQKVYLGRPWRVLARVVFQRSVLSDIINPAGWTTMAANATP
ncbi:hypothetical protein C0995_012024 [Termitomyces sp. Mi166|nr:hypothetical protein C0995_012024 [Termitomyces sp. Mi166\